jgi:hypothetical protein
LTIFVQQLQTEMALTYLKLNDIVDGNLQTYNMVVPFTALVNLPTLIKGAGNHPLAKRITDETINDVLKTVQVIRDDPGQVVRYLQKYVEIKTGASVMGAIGIVGVIGQTSVNFTLRFIEVKHNTPRLTENYTYTIRVAGDRIGPIHIGGGHYENRTGTRTRGPNANEVLAIQNALASRLMARRPALLAY